jgi:DNA-binding FadR family transcriptional regulator
MYEIRRVLEAHAAAAARRTTGTVETLFALIEAMEATDDPAEASELDHRFHAEIARSGGNPALASLLAVFRSRSRKYQIFTFPEGPELRRKSDDDHRVLATAIADRDPGAAAGAQTERWLRALMPPVEEDRANA